MKIQEYTSLGELKKDLIKSINIKKTDTEFEIIVCQNIYDKIKEDDLLIIISYPRYSRTTLDAARFVKERNTKIVAITDTEESPAYELADVSLLSKSNIVSFVDSLVVPMAMINQLIINISLREKEEIVEYFNTLERLWDHNSIYQNF